MKYIHLFQTIEDFESVYNSSEYEEPWLSYTEENSMVTFNKTSGHTPDYRTMYLTFDIISGGTISWMLIGDEYSHEEPTFFKTISYSLNDGETWTDITSSTAGTYFNVNAGDKVLFKGDNPQYMNDSWESNSFSGSTAKFNVEGNIMSLVDSTGFTTATTLQSGNTFSYIFQYCTGLLSAENLILPATTLTEGCYSSMFQNCSSLTTPPELPATTLAVSCYSGMFFECFNLDSVPSLPAETMEISCYASMFNGCTSLTSVPSDYLPSTLLSDYCYCYMFQNCSALTEAPDLLAETLNSGCYDNMFNGCSSLNYIRCLATDISQSGCTSNWVNGVSQTGRFIKASGMSDWETGVNGIPSDWVVESD